MPVLSFGFFVPGLSPRLTTNIYPYRYILSNKFSFKDKIFLRRAQKKPLGEGLEKGGGMLCS